ncbi:facilitated trehalose transporter Tret1-like [Limulus polyphemus]|uniref:Facilitated trehalose transporter Tret1-like n=1 Tax=Limulus polyphemus TaxID=6850 RepID=A0ABM1BM77_LIMPO|nr:facilitated trehalose transporter Tret1-like [Limulus polyphemus]
MFKMEISKSMEPNNTNINTDITSVDMEANTSMKKQDVHYALHWKMFLASGVALIGAVGMGMVIGFTAPALPKMIIPSSPVILTEDQGTWFASLMAVGALVGGLTAGPVSEILGRKKALILMNIPFILGWLLIVLANGISMLYVGRLLTGICTGMVSVTAPMYVVEISTPNIRGMLGTSFQVFVTIGILAAMTLGVYLSWTWLAVTSAILQATAMVSMIPIPESPSWLMNRGRKEEAVQAIYFFQGKRGVDAEKQCEEIIKNVESDQTGRIALSDFKQEHYWKPALLSIGLMFFQQLSGINAILFYTVEIFREAGSSLDESLSTILVAVVMVLFTILGSFLVDRAGRRILLLISGVGTATSLFCLGLSSGVLVHKIESFETRFGWIPLVCLLVYISTFAVGFGPLPWFMTAEMVPQRARSIVNGIVVCFNWTFVFMVTKTFDIFLHGLNQHGTYWLFAAMCALSCLFTLFLLPETKGKSLEQIQKYFLGIKGTIPTSSSQIELIE